LLFPYTASVSRTVVVVDPAPAYRRGLEAALADAGFPCAHPDDVEAWAAEAESAVVLLSVGAPSDADLLMRLAKVEGLTTVVLLHDVGSVAYLRAFQQGASAVVPWDAPLELITGAVQAALHGMCLVPLRLVHALATEAVVLSLEAEGDGSSAEFSDEELGWLRELAAGKTVVELARTVAYSEREMFRLLHGLYVRLGATSRTEAVVKASQAGLLDDVPEEQGFLRSRS